MGGRVSRRQTTVDGRTINLDLTWTDLGRLNQLTHPDDTGIADPSRTVSHSYLLGLLSGITGYASSITYHPNLMVEELARSDHLGTIRRITDTATPPAIVAAHDYYPFGSEATSPSQDSERMKWAGSERDQQGTPTVQTDDLDYLHARYQTFNLGRFLSLDPVRGTPKRPQSFNLFAYVSNNPINRTDPLGLLERTTTPQASGGLTTMVGDGLCASQDDASDPDCEAYQRKVREEEEAKRAKLLVLEAVNAGARSPEETVALAHRLAGQGLRVCLGCARVLQGNSRTIGRQGAFPGRTVSAGSAAVIPSQWGGKAKLRPILDLVGGTAGGSAFRGISDVVGGDSPIPGWGVREALQLLFPGQLILELPSAPTDQGSMVDVLLVGLPRGVPCPAGTSECT